MRMKIKKKAPLSAYDSFVSSFRVPFGHWQAFKDKCDAERYTLLGGMTLMIEAWVGRDALDQTYRDLGAPEGAPLSEVSSNG